MFPFLNPRDLRPHSDNYIEKCNPIIVNPVVKMRPIQRKSPISLFLWSTSPPPHGHAHRKKWYLRGLVKHRFCTMTYLKISKTFIYLHVALSPRNPSPGNQALPLSWILWVSEQALFGSPDQFMFSRKAVTVTAKVPHTEIRKCHSDNFILKNLNSCFVFFLSFFGWHWEAFYNSIYAATPHRVDIAED